MSEQVANVFQMYVEGINKQTEALQSAFEKMVELGFVDIKTGEIQETPVQKAHTAIERPAPITDSGRRKNKPYHLSIKLQKDSTTYSNQADMESSRFTPGHGLDEMKEAVVGAGRMEIHVEQDELFKYTFTVYKDGKEIGTLPNSRDNKDIKVQLELHPGKVFVIDTKIKSEIKGSIFTSLHAQIVEIREKVAPVQSVTEEVTQEVTEVEEEVISHDLDALFSSPKTVDKESDPLPIFGEMDMGSFVSLGGDK